MDRTPVYTALAGVIGIAIGAGVTGYFSFASKQREMDIKLVEISVDILRAPIDNDVSAIRGWALDVIEAKTGTRFSAIQRTTLLDQPLPAASVKILRDLKEINDPAFKTWQQRPAKPD